jgi:hypothetical protein
MKLFIVILLSAILLGCISSAQENNVSNENVSEPKNVSNVSNDTIVINETINETENETEEEIVVTLESCIDSDGTDIYQKGSINEFGNIFTDRCVVEQIKEYYCEDGKGKSKLYDCPTDFTCKDGKCTRGKQKCFDTDGGNDIHEAGSVTIDSLLKAEYLDKCVDDENLREYYCEEDELVVNDVECTCSMARCVN